MPNPSFTFTKMHGLGNDFVVIDAVSQAIDWRTLPAANIADRHLGVGCDQILVIESSENADFFCRIMNADGSEAEQCGNGLRCVGKYIHDNGLSNQSLFNIATIAGIFPVEIQSDGMISVTLSIPILQSADFTISLPANAGTVQGASVSMGNPHFIIKVADINNNDKHQWSKHISIHPQFPNGTNVGFMQMINPNHIRLRTYERGSGETLACGSNACAAVAAGILDGSLHSRVKVDFKCGSLTIEWDEKNKPVRMTGPAETVFKGKWGGHNDAGQVP